MSNEQTTELHNQNPWGLETKDFVSVIIPAYNEESMIEKAFSTIDYILSESKISHEIIFIDDGSKDNSWKIIQTLSSSSSCVKGIHFSRNFGKEAAIYAGLSEAKRGGCCVVIDCDLQHPPEIIVEMYQLWKQGFEVVEGVKSSRGEETIINKVGARLFYSLMSKATGIDMCRASDFKLLDDKVVIALLNMREKNAFFRALSSWVGFKTIQIEFDVREREIGESKWSIRTLTKYAINNVTSFSAIPMQLVTFLGAVLLCVSIVLGIITLVQKITGQALEGFTTVIISQLFSSSIIMISLGIIGYYIAKIYDEIKDRPKYIISEICGGSHDGKDF